MNIIQESAIIVSSHRCFCHRGPEPVHHPGSVHRRGHHPPHFPGDLLCRQRPVRTADIKVCEKILSLRRFYAGAGGHQMYMWHEQNPPLTLWLHISVQCEEGLHIRGAKVADPSLTLGRNLTKGDIIVYVKGTGSQRSLSLKVNGLSLGTPKGGEGR